MDNIERHLVDKTKVKITRLNYFAYLGEWFITRLGFLYVKHCSWQKQNLVHSMSLHSFSCVNDQL